MSRKSAKNSTDKNQSKSVFSHETKVDEIQAAARNEIANAFHNSPLPSEELLFNLGLYTRSSLLVKFLVMDRLYQRFLHLPGSLVEFGTWWGQNLVLLENLRAIHEPFNKERKIIGFDTFKGYSRKDLVQQDINSNVWQDAYYSTNREYKDVLRGLLDAHVRANVLGNVPSVHELIEGDVSKTAPRYFKSHPEQVVALAFFDIGLYKPTKSALLAIKSHLVRGSIIVLDEFTWPHAPGEARAFREAYSDLDYEIEKCSLYPSKAIITIC